MVGGGDQGPQMFPWHMSCAAGIGHDFTLPPIYFARINLFINVNKNRGFTDGHAGRVRPCAISENAILSRHPLLMNVYFILIATLMNY